MADIRIKDLTTTASSTASDDFIAVDGTTNGTRKLNAFSPTFGGNATVTGTLTVNGTSTFNNTLTVSSNVGFIGKSGSGTGGNWRYISDDGTSRWLSGILGSPSETAFDIYDIVNGRSLLTLTAAGVVKVPQTTASTTTSTGALVVGNGTSGGLGVGGSANIQGNLTLGYASTGDSVLKVIRSTGGNEWLQIAGWSAGSLGNNAYSIDAVNGASARPVYFRRSTDAGSTYSTFLTWDTSNNATFSGTTASTSTSSGALVVSGGVGVAGALNCGGLFDFAVSANSTQVYTIQNTSTGVSAATRLTFVGGASSGNIQLYGSGHSTPNILQYASPSSHAWQCNGVERATLSSAGALTVSSSLTTGAPSGGTAAAWKLGTVATVSPTSPNRTIEVDIGGTIYYIHAKTTNN